MRRNARKKPVPPKEKMLFHLVLMIFLTIIWLMCAFLNKDKGAYNFYGFLLCAGIFFIYTIIDIIRLSIENKKEDNTDNH